MRRNLESASSSRLIFLLFWLFPPQRMKAADRKNISKAPSGSQANTRGLRESAAAAPGIPDSEQRYTGLAPEEIRCRLSCVVQSFSSHQLSLNVAGPDRLPLSRHSYYLLMVRFLLVRRGQQARLPPPPPETSPGGGALEKPTPQALASTPARTVDTHSERSGDDNHRASLGGLGADSTWGDGSSGALLNTSRCVEIPK